MTTLSAYAAPHRQRAWRASGHCPRSMRGTTRFISRSSAAMAIAGRAARRADRRGAATPRASARRISSAMPRSCSPSAGRRMRRRRSRSITQAAPDIAWVAWLGAAVDPRQAPPRPFYLRAPDAKPPDGRCRSAAQPRRMMRLAHRAGSPRHRRRRARDVARCGAARATARRIVSSRLGRRRIRAACCASATRWCIGCEPAAR